MEHFKSLSTKEAEREANERSIEQTARIQKLFQGSDGELGLKAIDGLTGYDDNTFHSDPYKHAYNAGKRAVSVILHHLMDRDIKKAKAEMERQNGKM